MGKMGNKSILGLEWGWIMVGYSAGKSNIYL